MVNNRIYNVNSRTLSSETDCDNNFGDNIFKLIRYSLLILFFMFSNQSFAQIKDAVRADLSFIINKFPYSKTKKFEQEYCMLYPDVFDCKDIKDYDWSLFDDKFNLADPFFKNLYHRPITKINYDALNIAGLYLRQKRPQAGDLHYEYTYLDIELDTLTNLVYAHNDPKTATNEKEVQFKKAYLELLKENLFIIDENTYSNELTSSNNFKGAYYKASRKFVLMQLQKIIDLEYNSVIQFEIEKLIKAVEPVKTN